MYDSVWYIKQIATTRNLFVCICFWNCWSGSSKHSCVLCIRFVNCIKANSFFMRVFAMLGVHACFADWSKHQLVDVCLCRFGRDSAQTMFVMNYLQIGAETTGLYCMLYQSMMHNNICIYLCVCVGACFRDLGWGPTASKQQWSYVFLKLGHCLRLCISYLFCGFCSIKWRHQAQVTKREST